MGLRGRIEEDFRCSSVGVDEAAARDPVYVPWHISESNISICYYSSWFLWKHVTDMLVGSVLDAPTRTASPSHRLVMFFRVAVSSWTCLRRAATSRLPSGLDGASLSLFTLG